MATEQENKEKKEYVRKILQTQIVCEKREEGISYDSNDKVIRTGQKYCNNLDEDMSEFAIGFYEIVYSDIVEKILHGHILKSDGTLVNCCFAGDTMNSFNSIANLFSEAGKTIKERKQTNKENWPDRLKTYEKQYHCLANFWILPFCIGRTGKKLNYYDSMDIFLEKLNSDYKILEKHSSYFNAISTFPDFKKIHCITEYELNSNTLSMYKEKVAEELIGRVQNTINKRAEEISERHYEKLWKYFLNECKFKFPLSD